MAPVTTRPVNRDVFIRYLRIVLTTLRPRQRGAPGQKPRIVGGLARPAHPGIFALSQLRRHMETVHTPEPLYSQYLWRLRARVGRPSIRANGAQCFKY